MKSILLHVQDDPGLDGRLSLALDLAQAFDAHLSCLHVVPLEAYVSFDSFGGVFVLTDVLGAIEAREQALRDRIQARLAKALVPFDYEPATGPVGSTLASRAALADLVIVGRQAGGAAPRASALADGLSTRTATPLFVCPDAHEATFDVSAPAMVAWDGSIEAAHAVRGALPLLARAERVGIVRLIPEPQGDEAFPSTRLLSYLSRHGIHADYDELVRDGAPASDQLVRAARAGGAAYLVAGSYGHVRLREWLFGGTSRDLEAGCTLPLLVAH